MSYQPAAVAAILTETTCSEACWMAREDVCRCSCNGKNHGCLKTKNGVRPTRMSKINGVRYELKAVGLWRKVYTGVQTINRAAPKRRVGTYEYNWYMTDKGAPARMKRATSEQVAKWEELKSYLDAGGNRPYMLWVRVEPVQAAPAASTPAATPAPAAVPLGACLSF